MAARRRSNRRPYHQGHVPLDMSRLNGIRRAETGPHGDEYTVQQVRGSEKTYRCPGCLGDIAPGIGHTVVWRTDSLFGAEAALADRRHWHSECWRRRLRPN